MSCVTSLIITHPSNDQSYSAGLRCKLSRLFQKDFTYNIVWADSGWSSLFVASLKLTLFCYVVKIQCSYRLGPSIVLPSIHYVPWPYFSSAGGIFGLRKHIWKKLSKEMPYKGPKYWVVIKLVEMPPYINWSNYVDSRNFYLILQSHISFNSMALWILLS